MGEFEKEKLEIKIKFLSRCVCSFVIFRNVISPISHFSRISHVPHSFLVDIFIELSYFWKNKCRLVWIMSSFETMKMLIYSFDWIERSRSFHFWITKYLSFLICWSQYLLWFMQLLDHEQNQRRHSGHSHGHGYLGSRRFEGLPGWCGNKQGLGSFSLDL